MTALTLRHEENRIFSADEPTCYILYWQENEWVSRLKAKAPEAERLSGVHIEVVPVEHFASEDGTIRYPDRSHSIQLRPLDASDGNQRGWLVWYWYNGRDPSVLWPYAQ